MWVDWKFVWKFVFKYVKYNLVGGLCFALATTLFFLLNNWLGITWAWFVSNFLVGGVLSFFVQLLFVYDDADGKKIRKRIHA
jgi:RsiW-degrading membrane proteinase PrsW (M82 family)